MEFTKVQVADVLLNDLIDFPHVFVLACVMDRQIKAERAWLIPYGILERLGDFSIERLSRLSSPEVQILMSEPAPLHRFKDVMSELFFKGVQRIVRQYDSDASRIWSDAPSSTEVVYRFLEFDGVGPKIAKMAANTFAREFKVPLADYFSISDDVHVRRVLARLGLCSKGASVEQVIYKARALHPEFPGMIDFPCWEIGRNWCKPQQPRCAGCYMKDLCPSAFD